jgi:ubiquinone/menaquinone biosynthesis C-methylase UbiE
MIEQFASIKTPALVVDLGCGTGLSTRYWSERAQQVIGIDPNPEMLALARTRTRAPNTTYRQAYSHCTDLADAGADVVTCCQSLHWMDPDRTIAEVARVLRAGGVWAISHYLLPLIHWELDGAVQRCLELAKAKCSELGLDKEHKEWPAQHASRIDQSGRFHVVESGFQAIDKGAAERLQGLVRSLGWVSAPLKAGASEAALGLAALDEVSQRILANQSLDWFWSYRLIMALRK